jgi:protein-tyrosine phosphatase
MDETFIRGYHIDVVFNCTKNLDFHSDVKIKYRVPVDDNLEEEEIANMEKWSMEIVYLLAKEYMAGNRILVHCMAGRQRSAAVVAMFLIFINRCVADTAMNKIKTARPIAFFPKANFHRAITGFEKSFFQNINPLLPDPKEDQLTFGASGASDLREIFRTRSS